MTDPTPDFSPEAIAALAEIAKRAPGNNGWAESYAEDIPALLAALEAERAAHAEMRDRADKLAYIDRDEINMARSQRNEVAALLAEGALAVEREWPTVSTSGATPDEVRIAPLTKSELRERRRYVESRSARDHWGAAELELIDREARWIATVDKLIDALPDQQHNEQAIRVLQAQLAQLLAALEAVTTERDRWKGSADSIARTLNDACIWSNAVEAALEASERERERLAKVVKAAKQLVQYHGWKPPMTPDGRPARALTAESRLAQALWQKVTDEAAALTAKYPARPEGGRTVSAVFRLHLNSGPRDDVYLDHWTTTLEVASIPGGVNTMLLAEQAAAAPALRRGRYVMRLDRNGEPVPHNLEGFVECDWQGWEDTP